MKKRKPTWIDTTTKRGVVGAEWKLELRSLSLVIHHHMLYEPDRWFLSCNALCLSQYPLNATDTEKAKAEAIGKALEYAQSAVNALKEMQPCGS